MYNRTSAMYSRRSTQLNCYGVILDKNLLLLFSDRLRTSTTKLSLHAYYVFSGRLAFLCLLCCCCCAHARFCAIFSARSTHALCPHHYVVITRIVTRATEHIRKKKEQFRCQGFIPLTSNRTGQSWYLPAIPLSEIHAGAFFQTIGNTA